MSIKDTKERVTAIITKEISQKIIELAGKEKRSVSSMTAILIEKGLESFKKDK